jgi:hypothetical protein
MSTSSRGWGSTDGRMPVATAVAPERIRDVSDRIVGAIDGLALWFSKITRGGRMVGLTSYLADRRATRCTASRS